MIFIGLLMWLVARSPFGYRMEVPFTAEAGTVIIVLGMVVVALGMVQFARLKTTVNPLDLTQSTRLAIGGVYRYTRNPMYLGLTLILFGWVLHLDSPVNILLLVAFVLVITELQIKPEEAALKRLFGEEYEKYFRRVRRWL